MTDSPLNDFRERRAQGQPRIEALDHLGIKRLLTIDTQTYKDATDKGGLDERTKELLGLAASAVLRCDDCIAYHAERCAALGFTKEEIVDALSVSYVVGGSITIPHLRRVLPIIDEAIAERDGA